MFTTLKGQFINIAADVASMRIDKVATMTATRPQLNNHEYHVLVPHVVRFYSSPQSCSLYHLGMSDSRPRQWLLPITGPVTGPTKVD